MDKNTIIIIIGVAAILSSFAIYHAQNKKESKPRYDY